jgi:TetR/AcrR family tetracycline transcriptional repressor
MRTEERDGTERRPLSVGRILDAALHLVDAEGLEALTMRRLAAELGVAPMALYSHVRSKDELLAGLLDQVAGEVELPADGIPWKEGLAGLARSIRSVLLAHPALVPLVGDDKSHGRNVLRIFEAVLRMLRAAGFEDVEMSRAFYSVFVYTMGFVGAEAGWNQGLGAGPEERAEWERQMRLSFESLPIREFPLTVELAPILARCADDEFFEYGLRALLSGIEVRLGSAGAR